jgi:hypothetical protein
MVEPLPTTYGRANWQNGLDNWRKADGDWLQSRSILRYDTTAARDAIASPEAGMPVYNFATDRIEYRSKNNKWLGLVASEFLAVTPVTSIVPNDVVTIGHTAAPGQGIVLAPLKVSVNMPFATASEEVVLSTDGITIKTGTSSVVGRLYTDANYLRSDINFAAPKFVGAIDATTGSFSGLVTAKAGVTVTGNLSATGTLGVSGAATLSSSLAVTGNLTAATATIAGAIHADAFLQDAAQSGLAYASTRKDYVDTQVGTRVNTAGDTMTGALTINTAGDHCLRLTGVSPYVDFYNDAQTVRYGYIQATASSLLLSCAPATGGSEGYIAIRNTGMALQSVADISFSPDNIYSGFMSTTVFIWGKAASALDNAGHELYGTGSAAEGSNRTTTATAGIQNLYARHAGAADANAQAFAHFARAAGVVIGSITQNGTSGVKFNETSDRRAKTIVGPITDAIERLMALKTYRVTWNDDPDRGETDALIADEVMEVIPDAVTGEPDAVYTADEAVKLGVEEGSPNLQQLDKSVTIPVLIASLQEVVDRVIALEGAA